MAPIVSSQVLPITGTFAGALGLLCTGLATRIGFRRLFSGVHYGTGTGADAGDWENKVRAHANATEHAPLFLIILGALELNKALTPNQLVALGSVFTVARTAHSLQLAEPKKIPVIVRITGFLAQGGCFILGCGTLLAKCAKNIKQ